MNPSEANTLIEFSYVVQTYVLALLTHDGVGQLAYENAVHKVHFYTFLSVGW